MDRPIRRCASRLRKKTGGIDCPARTISENDLHAAVVMTVNQIIEQKDELLAAERKTLDNKDCGKKKNSTDKKMAELDEFEAFFEAHPAGVTEYDESLVLKLIEKITVYDDHMSFEFKSGLKTYVMA